MSYQAPIFEVVSTERKGDIARLGLKVVRENVWPTTLMPAGLYVLESSTQAAFELHKLVGQTDDTLFYETYEQSTSLPVVGKQYFFQSWWMPSQLEAVVDQGRMWVRRTYPDNGSHDHCVLTWETICAYTGQAEGYHFEPEDEWITVNAYETYIVRDIYRLRREPLPFLPWL